VSLALCVGVAFLLLAGSVFAQTIGTTSVAATDVMTYATQSARANQNYTIPATAAGYFATLGNITRAMGVARQTGLAGNFLLNVTLPSGFIFNLAVPGAGGANVSLSAAGGSTGFACTTFAGGTAPVLVGGVMVSSSNYISYLCGWSGLAPVTAPTILISTAGWSIRDTNATPALGTAGNSVAIKVQTFDAQSGIEFDNAGSAVSTATWLKAASALTVSFTPTKAIIDVTQARQKFVIGALSPLGGTDTTTDDNDASITVTYIDKIFGANGAGYTLGTDSLTLALSSPSADCALAGVSNFQFSSGASLVQVANLGVPGLSAAQKACTAATSIAIPGTNAALPLNPINPVGLLPSGGTTTTALKTINSGETLVKRSININAGYSYLVGFFTTTVNVVPATTLTIWDYNGSVLLANWVNANTAAFKSRFYIFNESSVSGATIFAKVYSIPLITSTTPGAQIGNTVTFTQTLAAGAGMTIRLEDIVNAANSGMTATNLAGPDGSFNVAVEFLIFAPQNSGVLSQAVSGYVQTMNLNATMSFGLTHMSRVE